MHSSGLFGKPLAEVTYEDLKRVVVDDGLPESLVVEYKPDLLDSDETSQSNQDTRRMLSKKISGFANAFGGFLLVGVREGKPNVLEGIKQDNAGFSKLLNNVTFECIYPPITNTELLSIPLPSSTGSKTFVHIVHIPRSSLVPHFVFDRGGCWIRHGDDSKHKEGLADIREIEQLMDLRMGQEKPTINAMANNLILLTTTFTIPANAPILTVYFAPIGLFRNLSDDQVRHSSMYFQEQHLLNSIRHFRAGTILSSFIHTEDIPSLHRPIYIFRRDHFHAVRYFPYNPEDVNKHFYYHWIHQMVTSAIADVMSIYKGSHIAFKVIIEVENISGLQSVYCMRNQECTALVNESWRISPVLPVENSARCEHEIATWSINRKLPDNPIGELCINLAGVFGFDNKVLGDIKYQISCFNEIRKCSTTSGTTKELIGEIVPDIAPVIEDGN